ncbi:uncharacterized protein LOC119383843 [Rhipicephalus sanguineus]|uniref:uncharacterized protein LOC119383843 n=1 Tax=Rhipicephalus sanguineus TaxID=34632 RepID=UPI001892E424|nr:uncharacterized protein LOC119383843 [Rhipicephalus sanguineus]
MLSTSMSTHSACATQIKKKECTNCNGRLTSLTVGCSQGPPQKRTFIWFSGPPSQYGGQMPACIGASWERTILQQKVARSLHSSHCPHTKWKHRESLPGTTVLPKALRKRKRNRSPRTPGFWLSQKTSKLRRGQKK